MKKIKNIYNFILIYIFTVFFTIYSRVSAQGAPIDESEKIIKATSDLDKKTFAEIVVDFIAVLADYVMRLLLALIIFVFLYGLMKYMFKGQSSDTARSEGRKLMLWGIIGIFVVTSWLAIAAIVTNTIGHTDIVIPQFK